MTSKHPKTQTLQALFQSRYLASSAIKNEFILAAAVERAENGDEAIHSWRDNVLRWAAELDAEMNKSDRTAFSVIGDNVKDTLCLWRSLEDVAQAGGDNNVVDECLIVFKELAEKSEKNLKSLTAADLILNFENWRIYRSHYEWLRRLSAKER